MYPTLPEIIDLRDNIGRVTGRVRRTGRVRLDSLPIGGLFVDPRNDLIASHIGAYPHSRVGEREIAFTDGVTALAMPGELVEAIEPVTPDTSTLEPATFGNTRVGDLIYVVGRWCGEPVTYSAIVQGVSADQYGSYFTVHYFHPASGTVWETGASTITDEVYHYAL